MAGPASLRRQREAEEREFDALIDRLITQRSTDLPEPDPLPDTIEQWLEEEIVWPHIDRPWESVRGLTPVARRFIEERTAIRWDPVTGQPISGSDVYLKPRQVQVSSAFFGSELYVCQRWAGMLCLVIMYVEKHAIIEAIQKRMAHAIRNLRPCWRARWRRRGNAWEYIHEKGREAREDVVSTWDIITAGSGEDIAGRLARGIPVNIAHYCDAGYMSNPEAAWRAVRYAVPVHTGSIIVEGTKPRSAEESWLEGLYRRTVEGRSDVLKGHFAAWYEDPLKRLSPESDEYKQAMAMPMEDADIEREIELGLDDQQIAYRRWYRCQGDLDERFAAVCELPEAPHEATVRPSDRWIPSPVMTRLEAGSMTPAIRSRITEDFSVSIWVRNPDRVVLGLYREYRRGREYAAIVGIDPVSREQVCELAGRASDDDVAIGIWVTLTELGLFPRGEYSIAAGRPGAVGVLDLLSRSRRSGTVEIRRPLRGDWSRLRIGEEPVRWDHRDHLWAPRRGEGVVANSPGWYLTGNSESVALGRLRAVLEDEAAPIVLRSRYLIGELGDLTISDRTNLVIGAPDMDLAKATALAILASPDLQPRPSLVEQWRSLSSSKLDLDGPAPRLLPE